MWPQRTWWRWRGGWGWWRAWGTWASSPSGPCCRWRSGCSSGGGGRRCTWNWKMKDVFSFNLQRFVSVHCRIFFLGTFKHFQAQVILGHSKGTLKPGYTFSYMFRPVHLGPNTFRPKYWSLKNIRTKWNVPSQNSFVFFLRCILFCTQNKVNKQSA